MKGQPISDIEYSIPLLIGMFVGCALILDLLGRSKAYTKADTGESEHWDEMLGI